MNPSNMTAPARAVSACMRHGKGVPHSERRLSCAGFLRIGAIASVLWVGLGCGLSLGLLDDLLAVPLGTMIRGTAQAQEKLPEGLKWLTNDSDPVFASPEAKKGGTYRMYIDSFPLTMRLVGPDANDSFANQLVYSGHVPLVARHPNTGRTIPMLAREWAYGDDGKTMYFKLDPTARWSDGKPFTADDVVFTLQMMRMKEIKDPFVNEQAETEYDRVIKFDDRTLAIVGKKVRSNLDFWLGQSFYPLQPKHFFEGKIDDKFVRTFNWTVVPGTGPYTVDKIDKGRRVTFKRIENWWGEQNRYFKNRFNADTVDYRLFRDEEVAFEAFMKGELDGAWLTRPVWWHEKAKGSIFDKGYAHRLWFYNEKETGPYGFFLNLNLDLFKDINVRYAFAHALNIDLVTEKLIYGDYERMNQFFEGYGDYTKTGIKARPFDIGKVSELMTASGWKRGSGGIWEKAGRRFSVRVTLGKSGQIEKRLEVLREEAKKAGLDLVLNPQDGAAAFKAARQKKFEVYYGALTSDVIPEPKQYMHSEFAKPNTNNFSSVSDKEMDALVESFARSKSSAEEALAMQKILKKAHEIGFFVGAWVVPFTREAYWRWMKFPNPPGVKRSEYMILVPNHYEYGGLFWLDEAARKETEEAMKAGRAFAPVTLIDKTFKAD